MRGQSVFGMKMTKNAKIADSELFAAFPKEKPNESLIDGIAEALDTSIGKPRESGHNVIFASIAIRALKDLLHERAVHLPVGTGINQSNSGYQSNGATVRLYKELLPCGLYGWIVKFAERASCCHY